MDSDTSLAVISRYNRCQGSPVLERGTPADPNYDGLPKRARQTVSLQHRGVLSI